MIINKSKSGIMILSGKGNSLTKYERKHENFHGFPYVKCYKYLGIILSKSLNMNLHLATLEEKLSRYKKLSLILRL